MTSLQLALLLARPVLPGAPESVSEIARMGEVTEMVLPAVPSPLPLPTGAPRPAAPTAPGRPATPSRPPLPPPLASLESARYRLSFGPLAGLGEVRLSLEHDRMENDRRLVRATGSGHGSLLGVGRMSRRVDADFDAVALAPRRWTLERRSDRKVVITTGDQPAPGSLTLSRREEGDPEREQSSAAFGELALDPLGLLLRVRVRPPAAGSTETMRVFDGTRLWMVTVAGAGRERLPGGGRQNALRLEGRAEPVHWDGRPDRGDRTDRAFVLWLSDDEHRMPLRLSVPVGIGELVAELVESKREKRAPDAAAGQALRAHREAHPQP